MMKWGGITFTYFNVTFQNDSNFIAKIIVDSESGFEGVASTLRLAKNRIRDYASHFKDGSSLDLQHVLDHVM
jgi:hypothetical protein